ncbi:hypothetical protein M8J76_012330 [Diaphorina citri]|nr:hypothetical protein M8J75_004687 [Diaphorina citri]KAI5714180.1 hypothetical protein M8J76_012330 [Diaphorina citri]
MTITPDSVGFGAKIEIPKELPKNRTNQDCMLPKGQGQDVLGHYSRLDHYTSQTDETNREPYNLRAY